MSTWCNNYINRVDKSVKVVNEDLLRWHAVFYSMCQSLFYIISFRHHDLMDSKRSNKLYNFLEIVLMFIFNICITLLFNIYYMIFFLFQI